MFFFLAVVLPHAPPSIQAEAPTLSLLALPYVCVCARMPSFLLIYFIQIHINTYIHAYITYIFIHIIDSRTRPHSKIFFNSFVSKVSKFINIIEPHISCYFSESAVCALACRGLAAAIGVFHLNSFKPIKTQTMLNLCAKV